MGCWAEEIGRCQRHKYDGNQAFVCRVAAGNCRFLSKGNQRPLVYGVSSENLFSDDPLVQSQNRVFLFFFEEQPDLKTFYSGLCLSVFKEHSDLENTSVFHWLESINRLFQRTGVL